MVILISVRQSDADEAKAFVASHFGKKLHAFAGRAVVYAPLEGVSKPNQWLKIHDWQCDWQGNSTVKNFRDLPIDNSLGTTTIRAALQSFTTPGPSPCRVFTAV